MFSQGLFQLSWTKTLCFKLIYYSSTTKDMNMIIKVQHIINQCNVLKLIMNVLWLSIIVNRENLLSFHKTYIFLFFVHHFLADKIAVVNALVRNIANYLPNSITKYICQLFVHNIELYTICLLFSEPQAATQLISTQVLSDIESSNIDVVLNFTTKYVSWIIMYRNYLIINIDY